MSSEDDIARRVRFFGVHELAAGWYVQRVAELVEQFGLGMLGQQRVERTQPGPLGNLRAARFLPSVFMTWTSR